MNLTIANNRFRMDDLELRKKQQTQECARLGLLLTGIQFVSDHSKAGWLYRRSAFDQRERTV